VASNAGYARPQAATPIYAALVPAYEACVSSTAVHALPLSLGSCVAQQSSAQLTVGTADSNARPTNSASYLRIGGLFGDPNVPGDQADVRFTASITDVRRQSDLTDYTGELEARVGFRITDRSTSASPLPPGTGSDTTQDFTFRFPIGCAATSEPPSVGATCALVTTADSIMPGALVEGRRAIWEAGQVQVYDGGSDGDADTTADNAPFMRQGIFAP
jgi:hypothetical protein